MNQPEEDVAVEVDGVSLRKTLNDHQFETLAVVFDIRSGREHAAGVAITDVIPEGVAVDDIGFHPEYGGEHWRAAGGEVVFGRTFEPGEQYTTVYGVRDFDGDRDELLAEPSVEIDAAAVGGGVEDIDDLVSEDDSDLVREVISGERDGLPSMEPEAGGEPASAEVGEATTEPSDDEPAEAAALGDGEPEAADADDEVDAEADEEEDVPASVAAMADEPVADEPDEAAPAEPDEAGPENVAAAGADVDDAGEVETARAGDDEDDEATVDEADEEEEPEPVVAETGEAASVDADDAEGETAVPAAADEEEGDAATEPEPGDEITVPVTGGIARVLTKELRAGNVSYEDRRLLREELLPSDGSTDARIQRLQTRVADLAAYTDALEAFLDEEGGAEAVLGDLEDELSDLAGDLADVEGSVEGVEGQVEELAADVDAVEGDLDDVAGDVEEVSATTEGLERDVEDLNDDVDRIEGLDRRLEAVEDDVTAIRDELDGLAEFRERLSSVFGAGGPGAGAGGGGSSGHGGGGQSDGDQDGDSDHGY